VHAPRRRIANIRKYGPSAQNPEDGFTGRVHLTSQFDVGQPLANDVRNGKTEAVTIGHIFPMAEPENLFVKVSEEVIPELCTGRTFRTPSALG
jgi:hypothetical protein